MSIVWLYKLKFVAWTGVKQFISILSLTNPIYNEIPIKFLNLLTDLILNDNDRKNSCKIILTYLNFKDATTTYKS